MKILIADKFSSTAIEELRALGAEIIYEPELKNESLVAALKKYQPLVLVVRSTEVTAEMLRMGEALSMVVRAGAGVNTIDLESASKLGILVSNCPGKNSVAVAELVMGLILSLDRRIPDNVVALRNGQWNKKEFGQAIGIRGRTLGLIGFGNIGREVAKRAVAFQMKIVAWSRSLSDEDAFDSGIQRLRTPLDVARNSDIVSVHVAATDETKNLCNKEFFAAMKNEAFFINTSRGDIVDEQALLAAVQHKKLRVGLDVYQNEPTSSSAEWKLDLVTQGPEGLVYGTHHIGASTKQAEDAIGQEALRIIKAFVQTGEVLNCVNLDTHTPATHVLTVRHLNQVGVLAAVLGEIQKANINVYEMENSIFAGDEAAVAKIRLSKQPLEPLMKCIKASHRAVISVVVTAV